MGPDRDSWAFPHAHDQPLLAIRYLDLLDHFAERDVADIETLHVPGEWPVDICSDDPIVVVRVAAAKRPEIPDIEAIGGPLALDGIGSPTAPS